MDKQELSLDSRIRDQLFDTLINNSQIIVITVDHQGILNTISGNGFHQLNIPEETLTGHPAAEVFVETTDITSNIQSALNGQVVDTYLHFKDHIFQIHYAPLFNNHDKIIGVSGTGIEITTENRFPPTRQISDIHYQLLAENTTDLIARHDTNRARFLYASPYSCTLLLGYEVHELLGRSIYDFVHPDDLSQVKTIYRLSETDAKSGLISYRIRHKDGHFTWFETSTRSVVSPDTGQREIIAVSRDITQRKSVEESLRQALARAQALYLASQSMLNAKDPDDLLRIVTRYAYPHKLNATLNYIDTDSDGMPVWAEIVAQYNSEHEDHSLIGLRFPAREFAMGYLIEHPHQTLLIKDVRDHEAIEDNLARTLCDAGVYSMAIIPLTVSGQWEGSINLQWAEVREFSEREEHLYNVLGPQLAALVRSQRLLIQTRKAEQRFRDIALSTSDWLWETDRQGRYIYCSERIHEVLGYTADEMMGQPLFFFAAPHEKERVNTIFSQTIPDQDTFHDFEIWNHHRNGHEICMLISGVPVLDSRGRLMGYRGVAQDITERKKAEESIQLYVDIVNEMQVGLHVWRLEDVNDPASLHMIVTNPAAESATGFNHDEIINKSIAEIYPEEHYSDLPELYTKHILNRSSANLGEFPFTRQGKTRIFSKKIFPLPNNSLGVAFDDVTGRVQAKQRIQAQNEALVKANRELAVARRKAEESARLKSQFLATMSHELRTPLNAIIGYTEIQLAGMTGDMNDEQRDYQRRILTNAENLLTLINEVLDLAKIEAGRVEIMRKPFAIRDFIQDIGHQISGLADSKGLELIYNVDKRLPDQMIGDPVRLKQIVINLVTNAVKFTEEGHVKIEARLHGPDAWLLTITDTGAGIPSHAQEYIFEEFRQVDGTSRRKHGGTGLGLSIVRKLTLLMGGNIRLKSRIGEGSVFTVTLPLEKQEVPDGK